MYEYLILYNKYQCKINFFSFFIDGRYGFVDLIPPAASGSVRSLAFEVTTEEYYLVPNPMSYKLNFKFILLSFFSPFTKFLFTHSSISESSFYKDSLVCYFNHFSRNLLNGLLLSRKFYLYLCLFRRYFRIYT